MFFKIKLMTMFGISWNRSYNTLVSDYIYNTVWNSLDYVYLSSQKIAAFDFDSYFSSIENWLHDNNYYIAGETYSYLLMGARVCEFYLSNFYSNYIKDNLSYLEISEKNLRLYLSMQDMTMFALFYPGLPYAEKIIEDSVWVVYGVNLHQVLFDTLQKYSLNVPVLLLFQLLVVIYILVVFIGTFFSIYDAVTRKEFTTDIDHSMSNASVEAEKEIFSADDTYMLVLGILFIFGSYFYFLAVSWNSSYTEFSVFFFQLLY